MLALLLLYHYYARILASSILFQKFRYLTLEDAQKDQMCCKRFCLPFDLPLDTACISITALLEALSILVKRAIIVFL